MEIIIIGLISLVFVAIVFYWYSKKPTVDTVAPEAPYKIEPEVVAKPRIKKVVTKTPPILRVNRAKRQK